MSKVGESRPKKAKTGGRTAGTPNKVTKALKEAILEAAEGAHPHGTVGYLKAQARDNPTAFLTLLGKVLPMQINGAGENGEHLIRQVERTIVKASNTNG
jgi:hypothetical protein